jgi:glycosyltransferase involved in cell wall biosynthesis
MKIGVVFNEVAREPNLVYRAVYPTWALGQRGHEIVHALWRPNKRFAYQKLLSCDAVHIYRVAGPELTLMAGLLRRRGIFVTWDNDDHLPSVPEDSRSYRAAGGRKGIERDYRIQLALMRAVNVVTTTTETLADKFRERHSGPIVAIDNYLHDEQFRPPPVLPGQKVVIGWIAGNEHAPDAKLVVGVLERILEANPRVEVVSVGLPLSIASDRYRAVGGVPFQRLPDMTRRFDIAIAPLSPTRMSFLRSSVKVKEYSAAGVPWVASARGPYAQLGNAGTGGLLVQDDGWEAALTKLIGSWEERRRLGKAAQTWARSQNISRNVEEWETLFVRSRGRAHAAVAK